MPAIAIVVLLSQEEANHGDRRHAVPGGATGERLAIARRLWVLVGEMLGQKWEGKGGHVGMVAYGAG